MSGERVEDAADYERLVAQETLILDVTEEICEAMGEGEQDNSTVSKKELAKRLGVTKGFVSQLLSGDRNLTLRTASDLASALGGRLHVTFKPNHAGSGEKAGAGLAAWREQLWDEVHSVTGPRKDRLVSLGRELDALIGTGRTSAEPWASTQGSEVERIAREFHESYEDFAVAAGWKTQDASAVPWSDLPEANRQTMLNTVGDLLARNVIEAPLPHLRPEQGETERLREALENTEAILMRHQQGESGLPFESAEAVVRPALEEIRSALSTQQEEKHPDQGSEDCECCDELVEDRLSALRDTITRERGLDWDHGRHAGLICSLAQEQLEAEGPPRCRTHADQGTHHA